MTVFCQYSINSQTVKSTLLTIGGVLLFCDHIEKDEYIEYSLYI